MLCGINSEGAAIAATMLPGGSVPTATGTKVANRYKRPKHRKPSKPKHHKSYRAPAGKH